MTRPKIIGAFGTTHFSRPRNRIASDLWQRLEESIRANPCSFMSNNSRPCMPQSNFFAALDSDDEGKAPAPVAAKKKETSAPKKPVVQPSKVEKRP